MPSYEYELDRHERGLDSVFSQTYGTKEPYSYNCGPASPKVSDAEF